MNIFKVLLAIVGLGGSVYLISHSIQSHKKTGAMEQMMEDQPKEENSKQKQQKPTGKQNVNVQQGEQDEEDGIFKDNQKIYQEYIKWKSEYNQNFNSEAEDQYRFTVFRDNYKLIEQFNHEETTDLRLEINLFGAITREEYEETYLTGYQPPQDRPARYEEKEYSNPENASESLDWVTKGAVAPVENQGSCGSCWAFSSKAGLEGVYQLNGGDLTPFSAQQLVDCAGVTGNLGCNGGDLMAAFEYTQQYGIEAESSYPYVSGKTGKATKCQYDKGKVVFKNSGQVKVAPENNAGAIYGAVQGRPLSIEVSASSIAFQFYRKGILRKGCGTQLDHGVFLTGYENKGTEDACWVIKNSWGTQWGDKGYIRILVQDEGPGVCGVQQYTSYPEP